MKNGKLNMSWKNVTPQQCSDTGMALVLVLLLLRAFQGWPTYLTLAIIALIVNMTVPRIYRPLAVVWFGLSHVLGAIVSRIILTGIFLFVVTPVALVRRMMGKDSLKLRAFRLGKDSVMLVRNHTYSAQDLEKPY